MVARQIREDGDVEAAALHAVERERVGGDLHRRGARPVRDHLGQQLLDQRRFRRGAVRLDAAAPRAITDRSEKPGGAVPPREDRFEQRRRRRLAVGARHGREHELLRRISVEARRQQRERPPRRRDRDPGRRDAWRSRPVADDRGGAAGNGLLDVGQAVEPRPADRDEEVARSDPARIGRDAEDLEVPRRGRQLGALEGGGEVHQLHGADGGGAVSSARRPAARPGAAALSARKRVWTEPGRTGEPGGGSWATTNPEPCRRARTPMRATRPARRGRTCRGRSAYGRPLPPAHRPRLRPTRGATPSPRRWRSAARGGPAPRRARSPAPAAPAARRAGCRGPGTSPSRTTGRRLPRSSTCPEDLRAPRRRHSAGNHGANTREDPRTWRPAPSAADPAFCAVTILPAAGKPGLRRRRAGPLFRRRPRLRRRWLGQPPCREDALGLGGGERPLCVATCWSRHGLERGFPPVGDDGHNRRGLHRVHGPSCPIELSGVEGRGRRRRQKIPVFWPSR